MNPSAEEIVDLNTKLDEITKLQEVSYETSITYLFQHLFPTPRGGKTILASTNAGVKKRVRDEEMFMRSVISDVDKGIVRPILPPSAARSPPGINPAILLKMGPPMLIGTPPQHLDGDQPSTELEATHNPADDSAQPTQTDDGIKYAKMPPALRPERPKKVEKTKVAKPVAPPSQPLQIPPHMVIVSLLIHSCFRSRAKKPKYRDHCLLLGTQLYFHILIHEVCNYDMLKFIFARSSRSPGSCPPTWCTPSANLSANPTCISTPDRFNS